MDLPSSDYVKDNVAVVHVFFEKQGFLKQIRGKIYDELVSVCLITKGCTDIGAKFQSQTN